MDALNEIISYYGDLKINYSQDEFIQLLREIQEIFECISPETQAVISKELNIGLPIIRTLIKQYPSLKEQPARHCITVCTGRNCHDKGCRKLIEKIEKDTGAGPGETTKDGRFQIRTQSCLKHCSTAPNIKVDDDMYTGVTKREIPNILRKYR